MSFCKPVFLQEKGQTSVHIAVAAGSTELGTAVAGLVEVGSTVVVVVVAQWLLVDSIAAVLLYTAAAE